MFHLLITRGVRSFSERILVWELFLSLTAPFSVLGVKRILTPAKETGAALLLADRGKDLGFR